ncbi:hypothetical protein BV25DRAFT_1832224 [Artomyces pyxidatus]|uniref:Uncharacterized protein n=1 Tax=Artomyces pyxidatus TaxID=48021 RepID=A0ACB8SL65_9AGAM|nr:hypothetical protein BV25DRAFT_1832224 [Artomyces pyxidatus]
MLCTRRSICVVLLSSFSAFFSPVLSCPAIAFVDILGRVTRGSRRYQNFSRSQRMSPDV